MGTFEIASGAHAKAGDAGARGLKTKEDAHFFGISSTFPEFSNEGKDLIIQYQLLHTKTVNCGGGYIKVGCKIEDAAQFGGDTQYNIMFGPDKCGYDKRTHLIFRDHNGEKNVLKTKELPYKQETENMSHLYRMILKPDNTVQVEIDGESVYSGSLSEDWELLEPKEINDPEDTKPLDWEDNEKIPDETHVKPEDWVEEARIKDETATQPADWDAEEDGEWEPPMKDNPDYKGEFVQRQIDNPKYKGPWVQKKKANPKYVDDKTLYHYGCTGFVGLDLWQVEAGTIVSNLIITDEIEKADEFAAIYKKVREVEQVEIDAIEAKKAEEAAEKNEEKELGLDDDDKDEDEDDEA